MTQRMIRASRWSAAAGGLVLAAGALAGASGVLAQALPTTALPAKLRAVSVPLAYRCGFPSGSYQVKVTVTGTFPVAIAQGQAIRPAGVHTAVTLPPGAVAGLARRGAARVGGGDMLAVAVAGGANAAASRWPGRFGPPVPLPAVGGVVLTAAGQAPAITASAPSAVTFTAGGLALTLVPQAPSGTAASPATVQAACALSPGQNARLATVSVAASAASPSQATSQAPSGARRNAGVAPASQASQGKVPKGCGAIHVKSPQIACGYITGYANVTKLNGSALLQPAAPQKPGLVNIAENIKFEHVPGGVLLVNIGQLYYRGREQLPPVRATFLAFGFEPITATLQITELKPIEIDVLLNRIVDVTVTATTEVSFRIFDASVNGVPWKNLGTRCETSRPVPLKLVGKGNTSTQRGFWNLQKGGTLGGLVNIPKFVHCGVGENLDPIFSASISSIGGKPLDFTLMTQGALCFIRPFFANTCPPPVPKPKRRLITG